MSTKERAELAYTDLRAVRPLAALGIRHDWGPLFSGESNRLREDVSEEACAKLLCEIRLTATSKRSKR
jgi:hypothetical protein